MASDNESNVLAQITLIGKARVRTDYAAVDIRKIFRKQFLSKHIVPISHVLIESSPDGHFLAHLQHSMLYSFETVKFHIKGGKITHLERNYEPKESSPETFAVDAQEAEEYGPCDFFVGTPVPSYPTAAALVSHVYNYAISRGYNPVMATGNAANIATYRHYLTAKLRGFLSVGHGNTTGILLADGTLNFSWFNTLATTALKPEVILWNSCQVFNDPLKTAVLHAGARTFIGGITNLAIGESEQVSDCFWKTELYSPHSLMRVTLQNCNRAHPTAKTFGIGGDTGKFA